MLTNAVKAHIEQIEKKKKKLVRRGGGGGEGDTLHL
jgi:hypothetical protein